MERLILCGGGHVSLEVAHIARRLEFELVIIDDRPEFASRERFPMAGQVVCAPFLEALDALGSRVHPMFARVFTVAAYLAIGPCLAIPRTASTSFEMAVPPFVGPDAPLELLRLLFSLAFFTGALLVALRPEKLTDRLGKVLCPILIALIVVTLSLIHI